MRKNISKSKQDKAMVQMERDLDKAERHFMKASERLEKELDGEFRKLDKKYQAIIKEEA